MSNSTFDVHLDDYKYGFRDEENYVFKSRKGLDHDIVDQISYMKGEPDWMRAVRHRALDIFWSKPVPTWGANLSGLNYDDIYYYIKPVEQQGRSWEEVPDDIKRTFDRLGIPEAERKFLAGAGAQYESEAVYHSLKEEWEKQGVVFVDSDTGLREYPDVYKEHFGTVVPAADNKYAALNTAVWSGGSFVYIPKGVKVNIPLQAYFRINAQNMGQFERTLIIADEGSQVSYVEGCTAPIYSTDSLHSGVIEIIVKKGARVRYTTIQNWSHNIYNLVTQRAMAYEDATMEWVDGNLGCITGDSLVLLDNGVKPIRAVEPGDVVHSLNAGMQWVRSPVVARRYSGKQPVFRLRTGDDHEIRATANHPFLVLSEGGSPASPGWKRLDQLKIGDLVAIAGETPDHGAPRQLAPIPTRGVKPVARPESSSGGVASLLAVEEETTPALLALDDGAYDRPPAFSRIVAIEPLGVEDTWDIEIADSHNFVANGLVVHNSRITMKYPSVYMMGKGARAEILSIAFANTGQHQDAGGKVIHAAPHTTSSITSKSISKGGGRAGYRGLVQVAKGSKGVKSNVVCDALILDDHSRSDTYPVMEIDEDQVSISHEATVSKVSEEQLFYLQSRGIPPAQAVLMIVNGFIEPIVKELPMEYAVEMNRLIQLEMEGSVG